MDRDTGPRPVPCWHAADHGWAMPSSVPWPLCQLSMSPNLQAISFHFCKRGTDIAASRSLGTEQGICAQCFMTEPVRPMLATSVDRITSRTLTRGCGSVRLSRVLAQPAACFPPSSLAPRSLMSGS